MNWDKLKEKLVFELTEAEVQNIAKEKGVTPEKVRESHNYIQNEIKKSLQIGMEYTIDFLKELTFSYRKTLETNPDAEKLDEVVSWVAFHLGTLTQGIDSISSYLESLNERLVSLESLVVDRVGSLESIVVNLKRRLDNLDEVEKTYSGDFNELN